MNNKSTPLPLFFDTQDWELAQSKLNEVAKEHGEDGVQLVMSNHPFTSGYWIEKSGVEVTSPLDMVYSYTEGVKLFENIAEEIKQARQESRMPKLITQ